MAACDTPYCIEHAGEAEAEAHAVRRRRDSARGSSAARGYGWRWTTRTRPRILRRDPVCRCSGRAGCPVCHGQGCRRASTDVDHIVPRPHGGDGDDNLQGLCHDCHSHKTATEDGGFGHTRTHGPGGG